MNRLTTRDIEEIFYLLREIDELADGVFGPSIAVNFTRLGSREDALESGIRPTSLYNGALTKIPGFSG